MDRSHRRSFSAALLRRHAPLLKTAVTLAAYVAATATASGDWSGYQHYTLHRLGLTSPEHTGSAGYQTSEPTGVNDAGQVVGYSVRVSGVTAVNGEDTWVWDGTATHQLGLTGGVYRGTAGYQNSRVRSQNAAGQVVGTSYRIAGMNTYNGEDAWVWDGSTTMRIGLTGGGFTNAGGYQHSSITSQNDAGQVTGTSRRYFSGGGEPSAPVAWVFRDGATQQIGMLGPQYIDPATGFQSSQPICQNAGGLVAGTSRRPIQGRPLILSAQDSWVWNGTVHQQIGLTGSVYTASNGYQRSEPVFLNDAGQVAGHAARFTSNGPAAFSQDAWAWSDGLTRQIGLTGGDYLGLGGVQYSEVTSQNPAGQIVGISYRFLDQDWSLGQDTWVWDGTETRRIGLVDGVYMDTYGGQYSHPYFQNQLGHVTGISIRTGIALSEMAYDAWVWNGTTTQQVGLTGGAYTDSTGVQRCEPLFLNALGHVVGTSDRLRSLNPLESGGSDSWIWDGTTTRQIGPNGGLYTNTVGQQYSRPTHLNGRGQAAGYAQRYAGNLDAGLDAWYYDPATNTTSVVVGSVRSSDGYAWSVPVALTEDGFLVGHYTRFSSDGATGETRAFAFRPDLGFTDLSSLVAGGIAAAGWNSLGETRRTATIRCIVGIGRVIGQSDGQSVFAARAPAIVRCCRGATCLEIDAASCTGTVADGAAIVVNACGPNNALATCCLADFNHDGVPSVDDLFAFLNAWFSRSPFADVGGDGFSQPTIEDLFQYLNGWFAGCS